MPDQIRINKKLKIIEVHSYGEISKDDITNTISTALSIFNDQGIFRTIADVTQVEKLPPLPEIYKLFSTLPKDLIISFLIKEDQTMLKDISFIETVALNHGARIRLFFSQDRALSWLLEQELT